MARKNAGNFSLGMGSWIPRVKSTSSVRPPGGVEVVVLSASDLGPRYGCEIANMCDQCGCAWCGGNARLICPSVEWTGTGEQCSPFHSPSPGRPGLRSEALRVVSMVAHPLLWTQIRGTVRFICERVRQIFWRVCVCRIPKRGEQLIKASTTELALG